MFGTGDVARVASCAWLARSRSITARVSGSRAVTGAGSVWTGCGAGSASLRRVSRARVSSAKSCAWRACPAATLAAWTESESGEVVFAQHVIEADSLRDVEQWAQRMPVVEYGRAEIRRVLFENTP